MQKWCPEAFEKTGKVLGGLVEDRLSFESANQGTAAVDDSLASRFRSESGFSNTESLLSHLTRKERAQLFDLVEQDVSTEYAAREAELKKSHQEELALAEGRMKETMTRFSAQLQKALSRRVQEIGESSARLAVQLAEKVVRKTVEIDPEVLTRALQTAQFKLLDSSSLQVSVHPDDQEWLSQNQDLCESLGITEIQRDRRIERGGCIIRTRSQEWDATLSRQLETLTEIVEEAIATSGHHPESLAPEEHHEPELD